jgi:hypothetical protein
MVEHSELWSVWVGRRDDGTWTVSLRHCSGTRQVVYLDHERYSDASTLFQELMTVLDGSIFTSLAIAEGVLPEGQLPLR